MLKGKVCCVCRAASAPATYRCRARRAARAARRCARGSASGCGRPSLCTSATSPAPRATPICSTTICTPPMLVFTSAFSRSVVTNLHSISGFYRNIRYDCFGLYLLDNGHRYSSCLQCVKQKFTVVVTITMCKVQNV